MVLGLHHILCRRPKVLVCSTPSTGNSPRRKYRAGVGEELLSFSIPLKTLFWNSSIDFKFDGRIGRAGSPETKTGRQQVLHR